MANGARAVLRDLVREGDVGALVCLGGSNAATVFSQLAPVLPLGIPKILMATAVAGDTRPMMGAEDVILLYPVVDVDGDNPILNAMIARLAGTASALKSSLPLRDVAGPGAAVAISMYGVTTPCAQRASSALSSKGFRTYTFHANGTGGRSIEAFSRNRLVTGVLDLTITELGNELLGGAFPAGPDRFTGAAEAGVPQVLAPGAIDMIAFGPRRTVPERYEGHTIHAHNDLVTLVRTTPDECRLIGEELARRVSPGAATTVLCIPLGGTSMLDAPDGAFFCPDAVRAFSDGVNEASGGTIRILESDDNINDPGFANLLVSTLNDAMATGGSKVART